MDYTKGSQSVLAVFIFNAYLFAVSMLATGISLYHLCFFFPKTSVPIGIII